MKRKAKIEAEVKPQAKCPMCGLERDSDEPVYECARCGGEGFDCCVAGNNVICENCSTEDYEAGR